MANWFLLNVQKRPHAAVTDVEHMRLLVYNAAFIIYRNQYLHFIMKNCAKKVLASTTVDYFSVECRRVEKLTRVDGMSFEQFSFFHRTLSFLLNYYSGMLLVVTKCFLCTLKMITESLRLLHHNISMY